MSVTIKDIANVAGVSYSTVSKALNNSPLVKDETKEKILRIAEEMGYEPNYAAQRLVRKQTKVIGLIWPTIERVVLSTLVSEIGKQINETPYSMILSIDPVQQAVDTFRRYQVDGIILFEDTLEETFRINRGSIPILSYGAMIKKKTTYPLIDANHVEAMHLAIQHLFELGHRKIAYIGHLSSKDSMQKAKFTGYKRALSKYGLVLQDKFVIDTEGLDWYDGYLATNKLLASDNYPTAIVGGSYDISGGIIRAAKEKNLDIPKDISIISYDNIPQMANIEVPLTCVGAPVEELAEVIVQSMIHLIQDKTQEIFVKKMTPKLIRRLSTASVN